jgi:hypothetical protein
VHRECVAARAALPGDVRAQTRTTIRRRPRDDDEQVIAFRILPRRLAASVFEYMPQHSQRALVMGQEDVAALLNNMSPEDRTFFLSELPPNVTKQLLPLLTDEERAEAVKLFGYAPRTLGRLMTRHENFSGSADRRRSANRACGFRPGTWFASAPDGSSFCSSVRC